MQVGSNADKYGFIGVVPNGSPIYEDDYGDDKYNDWNKDDDLGDDDRGKAIRVCSLRH